jgi:hypothetical protein
VKVELLERFENVVEPAQTLPPILIGPVEHRRKLSVRRLGRGSGSPRPDARTEASARRLG